MDPVKEKLNLLRKLANEKKAAHQIKNDPQEQEQFAKFVRNKLNTFIGVRQQPPPPPNDLTNETADRATATQFEKQKNFKLQYQRSLESFQKEKEEQINYEKTLKLKREIETIITDECPIKEVIKEEPDTSLIVFDDLETDLSHVEGMRPHKKLEVKTRSISIDNGTLSDKKFSIVTQEAVSSPRVHQNSAMTSSSKYINKMRNLYDKEKASSTESIHSGKQNSPFNSRSRVISPLVGEQETQQTISYNNKKRQAPLAMPETQEPANLADNSSDPDPIKTKESKPQKMMIQHLLDAFSPPNKKPDDTNKLITLLNAPNTNNSVQSSNNLFDKLRGKFSHNQADNFERTVIMNRHSTILSLPLRISRSPSLIKNKEELNSVPEPELKQLEELNPTNVSVFKNWTTK